MKISNRFRSRRSRVSATRRAQLLAAFERSGLSAAAFARQHHLRYTTFCNWRQRQGKAAPSPDFVQVELPPPAPVELVLELGTGARVRITEAGQIELAARLLKALCAPTPC
jgi:transposase-like protein